MRGEQQEGGQADQRQPGSHRYNADPGDLWAESLEAWVCGLNIQRFRALLGETANPQQRAVLARLIDEHEGRFQRFVTQTGPDAPGGEGGA